MSMTRVVIVSAVAALPDTAVKVLIPAILLMSVIVVATISAAILMSVVTAVLPTIPLVALCRQRRQRCENESGGNGSSFYP
jgi:hypothetical protein